MQVQVLHHMLLLNVKNSKCVCSVVQFLKHSMDCHCTVLAESESYPHSKRSNSGIYFYD